MARALMMSRGTALRTSLKRSFKSDGAADPIKTMEIIRVGIQLRSSSDVNNASHVGSG
nr:hypothetical protein [Bradyrhizobium sp. SRS-191]